MSKQTPPDERDLHAERQKESLQRQENLREFTQDLKQGKLPTTEAIAESIDRAVGSQSLQETEASMSPGGRKAVEDMKKTMVAGKEVLLEKNPDDQLQKVVLHGSKVIGGATAVKDHDLASKHLSGTSNLTSQAARRLMDLGRLVVSSSEFRNLIRDFRNLIQDALSASLSAVGPDEGEDVTVSEVSGKMEQEEPADVSKVARERVPDLYHQAHQSVEPVVIRYSRGETSATEAARTLASQAAETTRVAGLAAKDTLLSPERRDQLIERLRAIIMEIQAHPEFQNGTDELLDLVKEIAMRTTVFVEATVDATAAEAEKHSQELAEARRATRQLVENFCGGKSIEPLKTAIIAFGDDIANDERLTTYFHEGNVFLRRAVREPGYATSDQFKEDSQDLLDRGREVFTDKHMDNLNNVWRQMVELFEGAARDRTINNFTSNLSELMSDLFLDQYGQPTVKFDIIRDFARLLPLIAEKLEYIPVPRLEGSDTEMDYSLDNMVLRCTNLVPRQLHLRTDTTIRMTPPVPYGDRVQSQHKRGEFHITNHVNISLTEIRADSRDVSFYFKKKTGVVQLSDYGTFDIIIPDKGLSIYLTLVTTEDGSELKDHAFRIERADAEVNKLKLNVRATKHDILFKVLNPVITRQAKKAVEGALSERLQNLLGKIDEQLVVIGRKTAEAGNKAQTTLSSKAREMTAGHQKHGDPARVTEVVVDREP